MDPSASPVLTALAGDSTLLIEIIIFLVVACGAAGVVAMNRHGMLRRVRETERGFHDLYENIGEGVFRSTLDGRMISANPALVRLNGYDAEAEMLASVNDIGAEWYVDPNRRAELHGLLVEKGRVLDFVSEVYRHRTRERIWISESTRLVREEGTGRPLYYDGIIREVTETVRRLELQARYDKIATVVAGCMYQLLRKVDGSFEMQFIGSGVASLFGVAPADVLKNARLLSDLMHPEDRASVIASFETSARALAPRQAEYRIQTPAGIEKWIFGQSVPERQADGGTVWYGFFTDVTERKNSEARIYDLAFFDPLTKLANRAALLERLQGLMVTNERRGRWGALFFIDLNEFKMLNDTKGHHVGDMLLCAVADRLRQQARRGDLIARLGGDEFVIALASLGKAEPESHAAAAERGRLVLASFDEPFILEGTAFRATASLGVAMFKGGDVGVDGLLKRADLAMYAAKATAGGAMRFFEPEMLRALEERVTLTGDLRNAIDRGELVLVYQPQVDGEGACFGAETLLRWRHPERGTLLPADFLALAEPSGLAPAIDEFVFAGAAKTLGKWRKDPMTADLKLAVNVDAAQLGRDDFATKVKHVLAAAGADPTRLILELTEREMLDDLDKIGAVMRDLKQCGIRFALDDFGTGYSSLAYLKRLPIDALKIDRSFVADLETDQGDRAIVHTIVTIARSLDVAVVAEGVETDMQVLLLRQLGCHAYQGHLFAPAMTLGEFHATLPTLRRTETVRSRGRQIA